MSAARDKRNEIANLLYDAIPSRCTEGVGLLMGRGRSLVAGWVGGTERSPIEAVLELLDALRQLNPEGYVKVRDYLSRQLDGMPAPQGTAQELLVSAIQEAAEAQSATISGQPLRRQLSEWRDILTASARMVARLEDEISSDDRQRRENHDAVYRH